MSPFKQGCNMDDTEARALYAACRDVLAECTERLRQKTGKRFPGERKNNRVTAFHPEMAVHGKYRQPCPVCAAPVQPSSARRTRPTTAPPARPVDGAWPTAPSRACSGHLPEANRGLGIGRASSR